jgi:tRNA(Ile2) C34 agmatinyltransferase TiaS
LGEEDAIDEVIVFASDSDKGFAVFRLLGDNMRPGDMIKLMNSIDNGDIDVSKFSGIGELFEM